MKEHDAFLKAFGESLKLLRLDRGLSYRKMSQRCEVDYSDISKIEKGMVNIQLSTVAELAKALDVPVKELFDFGGTENSSD
ncbi:helix-turn-helix domain-containing protein [Flagellimonas onchidii]|uniref:helix-turn-helix domain-containing protein n=1 Tax=Flagellimonas onchidii TaxID=2562684 RepID=UPI001455FED9|nr:helix-turn-helix transcriptional regulator [Allomuricauda onchidii]